MIGVKKNPQSPMYTQLGVITKGTVIEVSSIDLCLMQRQAKTNYKNRRFGVFMTLLQRLNYTFPNTFAQIELCHG